MDANALTRLERIARNLPCFNTMDYMRVPTDYGLVYIAMGRGYSSDPKLGIITWQGVWAIQYGRHSLGRIGEVAGNATKNEALTHFLGDAVWMYEKLSDRHLLDESTRFARA